MFANIGRFSISMMVFLLSLSMLTGCGGGGGGTLLPSGGNSVSTPATRPVSLAWLPETTAAAPLRAAAAASVRVGSKVYMPDASGIIQNIPLQSGEFLLLEDGTRIDPNLGSTDSLFVKITDLVNPQARLLSQVWYQPRVAGGLDFRGSARLISATGETSRLFTPENHGGSSAGQLIGRYISRAEQEVSPALGRTIRSRNLEQLFAPLPVNPFIGFSGEVILTIEPASMTLGPNSQGQFTPQIKDQEGTSAIVNADWTTQPPEVVSVDITGLVTSRDVPGTVEVTARYENLIATAEVVVSITVPGEDVTGRLSGDTSWTPDKIWIVTGDIEVPVGVTLTIAAGTQVRFLPNVDNTGAGENPTRSEIIVNGTLTVEGLSSNRVVFRSLNLLNPGNFEYYGIRVPDGGVATIHDADFLDGVYGVKVEGGTLDYRGNRFRHGQIGIYLDEGSTFHIEGNEFEECIAGIECHFITDGRIYRNYFTRIHYNAISFYNSSPRMYGNILYRLTGTAIGCYNRSLPVLTNNLISDCGTHGLVASVDAAPLLKNNIIDRCKAYGLQFIPRSRPRLENNIISSNNTGMVWQNGVVMVLDQNDFSGNSTFNFLNLDTRNDLYSENPDSSPVYLYTKPYFLYDKPAYRNANWASPHLGDFRLTDGHPLLTYASNSGPVGLSNALDIGTTAVNLGMEP